MTDPRASTIDQLQARIQELEAQLGTCQAQLTRLSASESKFRAIAEYASDTICTINHAGELTYISPNVQAAIGYTPAELEGQVFEPLIHPDDLPCCVAVIEQVMTTGQPYNGLEYRVRHRQGHYVWHRANLSAYQDASGQPVIIAIGRDATQQKETEAALAKSQAQFEAILQNANVAIFAKDLEGRYIFANPWVSQEVGLPLEQILGKTDADLLPAEVAEQLQVGDRIALETGQAVRSEEIIALPQSENTYLAIKFPLMDGHGKPYAVCGISTNITDLKRTESALRASEARLNQILDSTLASIARYRIYADYNWEPEYFSSGTTEIWGFTPEEILADKMRQFNRVHPEDFETIIRTQVYPAIFAEQMVRFEYRYYHPQKEEWRWISQTVSSVRDDATDCWLATVIATDVTDRKLTEAALRESEAKLNRILDRTSACIADYRVYPDRRFIADYFSSGSQQIWGFTPEELLTNIQLYLSRYEPADLQTILEEAFDYIFSERPYTAEYRYHHPDGSVRWIQFSLTSYWDETEGCWRTPTLSIDITERKRAEEALARSEARFRQIVENASDLISTITPDGTITYMSPAAVNMLGYSGTELLGQHFAPVVLPEDLPIALEAVNQVMTTGVPCSFEHRLLHRDGSFRYVVANVSMYEDEDGNPLVLGIVRDITDRKRLEEELRQSEAKFRRIVENASDLIATATPDGIITYISPNVLNFLGYHNTELIGDYFAPIVHPDDVHLTVHAIQQVMATGTNYEFESRLLHRDGSLRYIISHVTVYAGENGSPMLLSFARDVTDRKRLEEELRQSEVKFRRIVENASDLIATATLDGTLTYLSPATLNLLGYTNEELIGQHFDRLIHPDDLAVTADAIAQVVATGESFSFDHRLIHRDGSLRYVVANLSIYEDENGNPVLLGISRDVTERRQLEEELRQSEAKFRRIVENANDTIATVTPAGIITYLSPNFLNIIGREASEVIGTSFEPLVHPDDLPEISALMQQGLATGEPYKTEYRLRCSDGRYRYFVANSSLYYDENNNPMILGISRDFTEQKRLEEELRQSEAKFRAIVENANDTIATVNTDGIITYLSPNMLALFQREASELLGTSFEPLVHPEDIPKAYAAIQQVLTTGEPNQFDYRLRRWDGEYRFFVTNTSLFYNEHNEPMILGISRDVTEQKKLEEELRQSEAKFRAIVEQASDIIYTIDQTGQITYVSPNITSILGSSSDALITKHFSIRTYPDDLDIVMAAVQQALAGETTNVECRAQHEDGTWLWLNCNLSPFHINDGGIGIMGIARDISDRKRLEEELRQSEYKFRAIVENANDLIYVLDASGHVVYMSPNCLTITGYRAEEIEGNTIEPFVHPDDFAIGADAVQRAIAGERVSFETRSIRKDGRIYWASSNVVPFQMPTGERGLMGISRDITDRKQAEEALRLSERKYRNIFENSQVGVGRASLSDGTILEVNQKVCDMLGFDQPAELVGQSWGQFCIDELEAQRIAGLLQAQGSLHDEVQVRVRDGSLRWWLTSNRVNFDEDCLDFVVADITDRKQLEEGLRQSEYKFRAIVENANDMIYLINPDGTFAYMSPNVYLHLGYTATELQGQLFTPLVHPDDLQFVASTFQQVLAGETITLEARGFHKDGSLRWFSCQVSPFRGDNGEFLQMGIARNITENKRLEEELRQSEYKFRAIVENANDLIYVIDRNGCIVYMSPNSTAILGYSPEEMQSSTFDQFVHPDDLPVGADAIQRAIAGARFSFEVRSFHKDGSIRWFNSNIAPFQMPDGEITLMGIGRDVTDRKQREEELRLAKDAAEAANLAKSTFLANMSHELRTPLNVILGFTQLMERENALSDRQRNFIITINRSGEHLLNLINDVLEMSKIEAGRINLNPEPFDLRHLLDTLQSMFRIRTETKKLALSFHLASNLPTTIIADEGKLRQVLINLLSNAVKFTEQGTITLQVTLEESIREIKNSGQIANQADNDQRLDAVSLKASQQRTKGLPSSANNTPTTFLHFTITDTGIGIAPEEVEQLFQPFVQTTSGLKVKEGTGLGLTISRQFVQLMGGDIQLQSVVGQGSTFSFQIPVTLTDSIITNHPIAQRKVLGLVPNQPSYRLLIVDDRADNRNLLTHLLQSLGFETQTASNGQEAVSCWQTWQPHLIWMDMRMPTMDGYEATRQIRCLEVEHEQSEAPDNISPNSLLQPAGASPTKIIALTASAFEEQRTTILATGCDDFIRKPFREQVIFDKLTEHLGVEFIYAEQSSDPISLIADTNDQLASVIQSMPLEWVQELNQAAIAIDGDRLLQLVAEIPAQHAQVATQLQDMVQRFCFDEILELIAGASTDA